MQPETQSARSRRSYGKIEDCEQSMLDKETWRKDCWFLFFICSLVWFLYTANCEFSSKLFYIKGLPRVVLLLRWVLFFQKYSSLHSRSLNNICTVAIPGQILGSLMQLESRRAVPQASQPPIIQGLSQDILIIPQLDGREVKNHCRLRDHAHFFHFLVFP